ncbi:MAG TPA: 3-keto-5-aminohexanoate cleavage protein [Dehalococcoidia bacterium]|nr:3-keto-5-aminohexanoate cleavage protein [Dehalococcoidia bacterium]
MRKVFITAAITGAIHTPTMSPYLPITPDEIVENAVGACEAGAAIAHIHVRDPETGRPVSRVDLFRDIASKIKKRCNMVLCVTTGGGLGQTDEERLRVVPELQPELCSFNQGSMNFGIFPLLEKIPEFKFPWEKSYIEMTYDFIFPNTFKSLSNFARAMSQYGTKPELEVYDVGMINNARWLIQQGLLKQPVYIQFVMGIMGGIPATVENLVFLYKTAREAIGDFIWSVAAAGRSQMPMAATSLALGGNVRVGLEDALYVGKGQLAKNNAEQVEKAVQMINALGLEVATPDDVREILGLKGLDKVNF